MFNMFRKMSESTDDCDDASEDEAEMLIEKIEEVHENGDSFVQKIEKEQNCEIPQIHPVNESIRKLCRVCSNQGLININSIITNKMMTIKITRTDGRAWDKPISSIISEVSGEKVTENDGLPQYICQHCLGYLQHAYSMRLRIQANAANLRVVRDLASAESIELENSQLDQSKITKREIDEEEDEIFEDAHLFETFKDADITISNITGPTATKRSEKLIEYKCDTCKKRMMTKESLADHQKVCEMTIIARFDADFRKLIGLIYTRMITIKEFVLRTIKLIFDTQKALEIAVKLNEIDIDSIADNKPNYSTTQRNYQSPDIGYYSDKNMGGCSSHR